MFALCFMRYISWSIAYFCVFCALCLLLCLWPYIFSVSHHISYFCMSSILRFSPYRWLYVLYVTSLTLFFTLCLMRCISRLVFHLFGFCCYPNVIDFLVFLLYIISFDKQLYVKVAINKYKFLVERYWMFCALYLYVVYYMLYFLSHLLSCLLLCLLLYLFLDFYSSLDIIDLLVFFSRLQVLMNNYMLC